jgi:hypothetical protein
MNDALKSRLLAMQSTKKKVTKKKGRGSDSDENESSESSDDSN